LRLGRDGWAGLAVLTASLVLFVLTLGLNGSALVPVGPGFYPRIVLGVTALLAGWLLLADLLAARRAAPAPVPSARYGMVVLMFAVFGVYVLLLPALGFRVGTFAYVAVANALLDRPRGARGWARVALVALLTTTATYLVFEHYLTVLLPRGSWTGF
jgi:putative tricarboxylic transport membrane protein